MSRRRTGFMLMGAGVVLALLAGVFVLVTMGEAEALREAQPKHWVVVAAVDIPDRSVIDPEQVMIIRVPENAVPPGASFFLPEPGAPDDVVDGGKEAALKKVIKQFTPTRIFKSEVINLQRLGQEAAKTSPSFEIPSGKIWYHFPASQNQLITSLDLVRPGDFIDIYYTTMEGPSGPTQPPGSALEDLRRLYTRRILQNLKVLNVGVFPRGTTTPATGRVITLEVTPDEALLLKWLKDAANITGTMEWIVRSPRDTQPLPPVTVNFDRVSQETGIGTGR